MSVQIEELSENPKITNPICKVKIEADRKPETTVIYSGRLPAYNNKNTFVRLLMSKNDFNADDLKKVFEHCGHSPENEIEIGRKMGANCIIAATFGFGPFLFELLNQGARFSLHLWELILFHSLCNRESLGIPLVLLAYISKHQIKINPNFEKGIDTLLMKASMTGNSLLVKYLLELGADPNYISQGGQSYALERCFRSQVSEEQMLEVIQELINYGADLSLTSENSIPSLFYPYINKHTKIFSYLLEKATIEQLYQKNQNGIYLLAAVSSSCNLEMFNMLIKKGGEKLVRICGSNALFPCIIQAKPKILLVIEMLIKLGANLNERNKNGDTLLEYAFRHDRAEIFELLREYHALETNFTLTIHKGNYNYLSVNSSQPHNLDTQATFDEISKYIICGLAKTIYVPLMNKEISKDHIDKFFGISLIHGQTDIAQLFLAAGADHNFLLNNYHKNLTEYQFVILNNNNESILYYKSPFDDEEQFNTFWRSLETCGLNFDNKKDNVIVKILTQAMLNKEKYFFICLKNIAIKYGNLDANSLHKVYQIAKENRLTTFIDLLKTEAELPCKILMARKKYKNIKAQYQDHSVWLDLQFKLRPKLLTAIATNNVNNVLKFVSEGADPNFGGHCWPPNSREYVSFKNITQNVDGITPLHMAILQPHALSMSKLIIDLGATLEISNQYSQNHWSQKLVNLLHMNLFIKEKAEIEQLRLILNQVELNEFKMKIEQLKNVNTTKKQLFKFSMPPKFTNLKKEINTSQNEANNSNKDSYTIDFA